MHDILTALEQFAGKYDGAVIFSDDLRVLTRNSLALLALRTAATLKDVPDVIGILCENSVEAAVCQLAGWAAGKHVVPLPYFFSEGQLGHAIRDSGITHCLTSDRMRDLAFRLGLTAVQIKTLSAPLCQAIRGGGQIIYTSGSTGAPKGVRLSLDQINSSTRQLAQLTGATASDRYLSILPLPLLLETICAICVPVITSAKTHFDREATGAVARGDPSLIADAFARHTPSASVLVPELLAAWTAQLARTKRRAPSTLRFVAVGGAPVPAPLAAAAWQRGIPAYEGYGLSECCAVVSLNAPGSRRAGTVGRPLPELSVSIEDGEIVVEGPTLMNGYVNAVDTPARWRTGDLGEFDADGYLHVRGRRDNLIVTSFGRNISPEWIEGMLLADPRFSAAAIIGHGEPALTALLVPSKMGAVWLEQAPRAHVLLALTSACRDAPNYALPRDFLVVSRTQISKHNLMTANGRWRRSTLADAVKDLRAARASQNSITEQPKELTA